MKNFVNTGCSTFLYANLYNKYSFSKFQSLIIINISLNKRSAFSFPFIICNYVRHHLRERSQDWGFNKICSICYHIINLPSNYTPSNEVWANHFFICLISPKQRTISVGVGALWDWKDVYRVISKMIKYLLFRFSFSFVFTKCPL